MSPGVAPASAAEVRAAAGGADSLEPTATPGAGPGHLGARRVRWFDSSSHRLGLAGAGLLAVLATTAILAPLVTSYEPDVASGLPFERPSTAHWLGTNDVGHDLFSQLVFGARVSLSIALLAALFALVVGLAVALVAGYHRNWIGSLLMRIVDLTLALPFLVLVIVLATFFGRGLLTTVTVIAAVIWARPARLLYSQVLKLREYQHVTAARAMGASGARIILRHLFPRLAPLAAAQFVRAANTAVLIEASLSFLGLGDPDRVSWGTTLYFANARNAVLTDAWLWWILPPGLALTAAIVGFGFVGFSIEQWADPRLGRTPARRRRRRRGATPATGTAAPEASIERRALEVSDLTVHYQTKRGPARAVDTVDISVERGSITGLVGESGSGKTTLVTALLGLTRPPARVLGGTVTFAGDTVPAKRRTALAARRGRTVSLIPQSAMNALNPAYTIHRQVAEAAGLTRTDRVAAGARATEVLDLVGIPSDRHRAFPHEFSGGMRQRAVIAMAIANHPVLLVADEPVTGLDVVTQARILTLLEDLCDRLDLAILLISHDLPLVSRVADDIYVMYAGRVVECGPAAEVTADPQHPYTRKLLHAFPSLRGQRQRLEAVSGAPPDLVTVGEECRFRPRCPLAFDRCRDADPPLIEARPGHGAACVLVDPSRA